MSRDTDAMQFVLDLIVDGMYRENLNTETQIGFSPSDSITVDQLPFAQCFAASIAAPGNTPKSRLSLPAKPAVPRAFASTQPIV